MKQGGIKKVPKPYKEKFLEQSLQLDLNIFYYVSMSLFIISLIMMTIFLFGIDGIDFANKKTTFYLSLGVVSLFFLYLFKMLKQEKIKNLVVIQYTYDIYISLIILFSINISFLNSEGFPQTTIYTAAICFVAMALNLNYTFVITLIWISFFIFIRTVLSLPDVGGSTYVIHSLFVSVVLTPISIMCYNGRVSKFLQHVTIIEQKEQLDGRYKKLEQTVHKDSLTGVLNRLAFDQKVQVIDRDGFGFMYDDITYISVIMMDIDYFKNYNDTYGHRMGDDCLRKVAKALANGLARSTDELFRYGGEEFIVFLPGANAKGAEEVAKRMLQEVREAGIPHKSSTIAEHVTISAGIVTQALTEGQVNIMHLVDMADRALYRAKNSGRDRYCIYSDDQI